MLRYSSRLMSSPSSISSRFTTRPAGPGLRRDQRHAQYLRRELLRFVRRARQLHAAALAAPAGVNLRLHHHHRRAQLLRHRRAPLPAWSPSRRAESVLRSGERSLSPDTREFSSPVLSRGDEPSPECKKGGASPAYVADSLPLNPTVKPSSLTSSSRTEPVLTSCAACRRRASARHPHTLHARIPSLDLPKSSFVKTRCLAPKAEPQ